MDSALCLAYSGFCFSASKEIWPQKLQPAMGEPVEDSMEPEPLGDCTTTGDTSGVSFHTVYLHCYCLDQSALPSLPLQSPATNLLKYLVCSSQK